MTPTEIAKCVSAAKTLAAQGAIKFHEEQYERTENVIDRSRNELCRLRMKRLWNERHGLPTDGLPPRVRGKGKARASGVPDAQQGRRANPVPIMGNPTSGTRIGNLLNPQETGDRRTPSST